MKKIAVIMGSASDLPIAEEAVKLLRDYGVPYLVKVCSAHRTPEELRSFVASAEQEGLGAFICIAGMAAHLAGAVAAHSCLPVVGVPVASGGLGGLDALLSTAQMPSGVPVATVAVNGGRNAAILCVQMLAISEPALQQKLLAARERMRRGAVEKDAEVSARLGMDAMEGDKR